MTPTTLLKALDGCAIMLRTTTNGIIINFRTNSLQLNSLLTSTRDLITTWLATFFKYLNK